MNAFVICVRENDPSATLLSATNGFHQPFLIIPREDLLIILDESIAIMGRGVGRVQKNQIAFHGLGNYSFKVTSPKIGARQQLARLFEIIVEKRDLSLCPQGNVELPLEVFAIQSVEAGSVQIKKLRRSPMGARMLPTSFFVIEFFRVALLKLGEARLHQPPFVANGSVGGDQSFIDVRQNCAGWREMKENRASAHKRFDISSRKLGKAEPWIIQKPSLAACPLDEWLQIVAPPR